LHDLQKTGLRVILSKLTIRNGSCQQLSEKNKSVRIVEVGHAMGSDKKEEKVRNHDTSVDQSSAKSDGRYNALNERQGGSA
jgi:hypothetical protein